MESRRADAASTVRAGHGRLFGAASRDRRGLSVGSLADVQPIEGAGARRANRSTSYATAGDQAYLGPDIEMALLHIRAWTGLTDFILPTALQAHLPESTEEAVA